MTTFTQQHNIGLSYVEARHCFENIRPVSRGPNEGLRPAKLDRRDPDTHYFHEVRHFDGTVGIARRMYNTDVVIWWDDGMVDVSTFDSVSTRDTQHGLLRHAATRETYNGTNCLRSNGVLAAAYGHWWTLRGDTGDIVSEVLTWAAPGRRYPTKEIGRAMRHLRKQVLAMETLMKAGGHHPAYDTEMGGARHPYTRANEFLEMVQMGADPMEHLSQLLLSYAGTPSSQLFELDRLLRMRALPAGEVTPSAKPLDDVLRAFMQQRDEVVATMSEAV